MADAARASEALIAKLREAIELARAGECGKPLADALWFCDDLLEIYPDYVERPDAGEGERGAFMERRERVAGLGGGSHDGPPCVCALGDMQRWKLMQKSS